MKKSKIGSSIDYQIKPRKVKFEWQQTPLDWIPNQPFVSYFVNEINMILPAGEFWFCRLYNKVLPQIRDEKLQQDVKAFIPQEAMQAHASANKEYLSVHNIDVEGKYLMPWYDPVHEAKTEDALAYLDHSPAAKRAVLKVA